MCDWLFFGTCIIELCHVEWAYRPRWEMRCWENRDMVCECVRSWWLTWKCSVQNLKYSLRRFPHCSLDKVAHLSHHHDEGLQKCKLDVWWINFAPRRADFVVLWHPSDFTTSWLPYLAVWPFWYIQIKIPFHVLSLPAGRHNKVALCYEAVLPPRRGALITSGIDFAKIQSTPPAPTWGMMSQQFISQSCAIFCLPLPSTVCTHDPLRLN